MQTDLNAAGAADSYASVPAVNSNPVSAVSWAAILAGASAAAGATLILTVLGSGLGFAAANPWRAPSPATFAIATAIWLIATQWIASGVGGYLTGRLRTRWIGLHTHEVFFRDTAHGLLAWAVGAIVAATLFGFLAAGAVKTTASAGEGVTAPTLSYDADGLLRSDHPQGSPGLDEARAEAERILAKGAAEGGPSADDQVYLARLVVQNAGVTPADAQLRVAQVVQHEQHLVARAKAAADAARKAAMQLAIFTALSMLVGAFIACVAAALGGQQRDEHF